MASCGARGRAISAEASDACAGANACARTDACAGTALMAAGTTSAKADAAARPLLYLKNGHACFLSGGWSLDGCPLTVVANLARRAYLSTDRPAAQSMNDARMGPAPHLRKLGIIVHGCRRDGAPAARRALSECFGRRPFPRNAWLAIACHDNPCTARVRQRVVAMPRRPRTLVLDVRRRPRPCRPAPGRGWAAGQPGSWQSGQALLASGWWRGALARKRHRCASPRRWPAGGRRRGR